MKEGSVLFKWVLLLVAGGLVCLLGLMALVRHEQHVGPGEEILWDDFAFSVLDHRALEKIGDLAPHGVFQVVRLEVRNHARRVAYRLDNHRVVLMDEQGGEYPVAEAAQKVLDPSWPHREEIAHGTTFASELAFDVPRDKQSLRLRISWGGGLIDFLDQHVFGPRDIALR